MCFLFFSPGTKSQQAISNQIRAKQRTLKLKWQTYQLQSSRFNERFNPSPLIVCPELETVKSMPMDDVFWNIGNLTHPDEPWAVDVNTQKGIQAYLTLTHAQDELRRIARELRQQIRWALAMDKKTQDAEQKLLNGWYLHLND